MELKSVYYLPLIAIMAIGCSSNKKVKEDLPYFDVRKNYPEREININDFADVTYVHLNADNDDYLYKGSIVNVSKNTLIVFDYSSLSILFFSKDGKPKSRFNRFGQGPEEYLGVTRILYDEESDEVFVCYYLVDYIQVYSSTGIYKRKIPLPQNIRIYSLVSFDNQSFFVFSENFYDFSLSSEKLRNLKIDFPCTTYYRFSKTDGEILDSLQLPANDVKLYLEDPRDGSLARLRYDRLVKGADGFYLCNPETDTVYLYTKDKSLTPVFHKIPLTRNQDIKVIVPNIVDAGRYQFFAAFHVVVRFFDHYTYYFRDKETGEFFRQHIILPDYKGKEFSINVAKTINSNHENGCVFELDLFELKKAYEENRLGGKLKELVATLNEMEDNNVFMIATFK